MAQPTATEELRERIRVLRRAESFLGTPYKWDGLNQFGIDCSGLIKRAFGGLIDLPHKASGQQAYGRRVSKNNLQPGDLLFYGKSAHHVTMYVGNGKMIEAEEQGTKVHITKVRPFTEARDLIGGPSLSAASSSSSKAPSANTVAGQVERQIKDPRVALAMLMAPYLEGGGSSPLGAGGWGVGDNGHSYGPYQINLPYHPGVTAADARDPAFAVKYMSGAYRRAVASVPASLWKSDPSRAAEEAIQKAENPSESYYASHGAAAVTSAYKRAAAVETNPDAALAGWSIPGGTIGKILAAASPGAAIGGIGIGDAAGSAISGWEQSIITLIMKGFFVVGGVAMVVIGGGIAAHSTAGDVASSGGGADAPEDEGGGLREIAEDGAAA